VFVFFGWGGGEEMNHTSSTRSFQFVCLFMGLGCFFGGMKLTYFSSRQDDKKRKHAETLPYHDLPWAESSFIFPRKTCTTPTICVFAETTPTIEFFVLPARLLGLPDVGGEVSFRWRKT